MSEEVQVYETATLTEKYSHDIIEAIDNIDVSLSPSVDEVVNGKMRSSAEDRNGVGVAKAYKELEELLESGEEDEELYPGSSETIVSGRKKQQLNNVLNLAGVVYGFVYDVSDLRTVPHRTVFEDTERHSSHE